MTRQRDRHNGPAPLQALARALRRTTQSGGELRPRLAALELDLRERDAELARLRDEYRRLSEEAERARAVGEEAALRRLGARLASPLSQLATLQVLAAEQQGVRLSDVLVLAAQVEAALTEAGLVRYGRVGAQVPFDPRLHEPLGQAELEPGVQVRVRFVGYRLGETVLRKAMISGVPVTARSKAEARAEEGRP